MPEDRPFIECLAEFRDYQANVRASLAAPDTGLDLSRGYNYKHLEKFEFDITNRKITRDMDENTKQIIFAIVSDMITNAIEIFNIATKRIIHQRDQRATLTSIRLVALAVLRLSYFYLSFLEFSDKSKNIGELGQLVAIGRRSLASRIGFVKDAILALEETCDLRMLSLPKPEPFATAAKTQPKRRKRI